MRTTAPPNTADTSENDQTGRITLASTKWRLCGIPHNRHTFAVRTLLGWCHAGEDVDRKLPLLSTYLGHVELESTYWYLQSVPELIALVSERLDQRLPEGLS